MSELERSDGLNLPQLVDLMHEIVAPDPVRWLPHTAGWWILAAWLLAVALLVTGHAYRAWRSNRYRREALAVLKTIEAHSSHPSSQDGAAQIAVLLKRTALAAYPRDKIAHLYGADWAEFLRESADHDPLVDAGADEMAGAAYRKDVDGGALVEPARRWIKVHRG